MNELLIDRLKTARTNKGIKQQEVADILKLKANTISNWEKGRTEPDIDTFVKLCDIYKIDCASLLADVYAFKRLQSDISLNEFDGIKRYRSLDSFGKDVVSTILEKEYIRVQDQSIGNEEKESDIVPIRLVSYYYKNASAGTGQIIFDTPPTKQIEIPSTPKYACVSYAIGVDGNSMQPTYSDGDILLVEMTECIDIGEIGIFQVNGDCFVKKLGKSELISLNNDYANIPLNESASCMGRVVGKLEN